MLEAMLRSDIPSVESCLDLTLDELNVLCQSPQASVKSKATKVCTVNCTYDCILYKALLVISAHLYSIKFLIWETCLKFGNNSLKFLKSFCGFCLASKILSLKILVLHRHLLRISQNVLFKGKVTEP